jgi:hypothetical protein
MRVLIIGPNLPDQSKGSFHVHKVGCRDILYSYPYELTMHEAPVEVDSKARAAELIYDNGILDEEIYNRRAASEPGADLDQIRKDVIEDYVNDLWFAPCTKGLE